MEKGFITVAAGEKYCKLAQHLAMTYRMFAKCPYPFYVITDAKGEILLKDYFDGCIVKELSYGFLDKMNIFTETPFTETIFLDADCSIVRDLTDLFSAFEDNGADVCAIGGCKVL